MLLKNFGGIEPTDNRDEFDEPDFTRGCERVVTSASDIKRRIQDEKEHSQVWRLLEELYEQKPRYLPKGKAISKFKKLEARFPNFREPLNRIEQQLLLCKARGARRFTLPNMLFVGSPGIGKTYMMKELCYAIGVSFQQISMSLACEGFYLTGLQRGYTSTTPGQLAKMMGKSKHINPVVLLDELEKGAWNGKEGRTGIENPLLQMFDRGSAGSVEDLCLETTLNLSEVSYIGTANTIAGIPAPILSRMTIFNIPDPTGSMLQNITEVALNTAARDDLGIDGITIYATPDVADVFNESVSPRTIRNAAAAIIAPQLIAFPDRDEIHICADDIIPHMPKVAEKSRSIGFHANV